MKKIWSILVSALLVGLIVTANTTPITQSAAKSNQIIVPLELPDQH